jgi:hypothetical protein
VALLLGLLVRPGAAQEPTPPVFNPANGHWYQVIHPYVPITWYEARAAAESLSFGGYRGHLATITSLDENQFIWNQVIGPARQGRFDFTLGGYQDLNAPDYREPGGGWRWVTGEPFVLTLWAPGEPNNGAGIQHVLQFWQAQGDRWDDDQSGPRAAPYIVEYEPPFPFTGALVQLVPAAAVGGSTVVGQVSLAVPAGPGGTLLVLTSSHPAVAVAPATVIVPHGSMSAAFVITTFPVAVATTVTFIVTGPGTAGTATLQVLPAPVLPPSAVYNPANGHWYQAVRMPGGIPWHAARAAAEQLSYAGYPGHLATITSTEENQFILQTIAPASYDGLWLGGYQETAAPDYFEPAGGWRWITGEPWAFSEWSPGEPNNNTIRGPENHLHINFSNTTWNDVTASYPISGYLVEYEPPPFSAGAPFRINGVTYAPSYPRETLVAVFSRPDGGVTLNAYYGHVMLRVTGVGQAYGAAYNDAFYLFTAPFSWPQNGHDGGYYQLSFGTSPLAPFSLASNARNVLVGPLPAYNPAHDYTFVIDTRLWSPAQLHFGVSDGGYNDNTGAYVITATQLVPLP